METQENLRRKMEGAKDIKSVVRTMKAVAASNIGQYEMAVNSLSDYYHTVALGIVAYFREEKIQAIVEKRKPNKTGPKTVCAIVFGSDQGLVGQFNDSLAHFVSESLHALPDKKEIWAVGERIQLLLLDDGFAVPKLFPVPNSIQAVTPLIEQLLILSEENTENENRKEVYLYHNQPKREGGFEPICQRLLPLDEKWRYTLAELQWPTKKLPQVLGGIQPTLLALISAYLFVSLFKACAESLASENASRLAAMQRAEKNIEELLDTLGHQFHGLRQSAIDEELFEVVSGFEALNNDVFSKKIKDSNCKYDEPV